MTVVLVVARRAYIGVSGDSKPSTTAGSTFNETDTGASYMFDGTSWQRVPYLRAGGTA